MNINNMALGRVIPLLLLRNAIKTKINNTRKIEATWNSLKSVNGIGLITATTPKIRVELTIVLSIRSPIAKPLKP